MATSTIHCPKCNTTIDISEALHAQATQEFEKNFQTKIEEEKTLLRNKMDSWRKEQQEHFDKERKENEARIKADADANFKRMEESLAKNNSIMIAQLKANLEESFKKEKQELEAKLATAKAKENEAAELRSQLAESQRNAQAKQKEQEFEMQQALLNKEREAKLNSEKELNEKLAAIQSKMEADKAITTKTAIEAAIADEQKKNRELALQLESMKRIADQKSTQIQGEANERHIEQLLQENFRTAEITNQVAGRSSKAADILFKIREDNTSLQILIECKETQAFSADWIDKLKSDGRNKKADILVLITRAMPKNHENELSAVIDDVYIINASNQLAIISNFRLLIKAGFQVKKQSVGMQNADDKMKKLYVYLMSAEFKNSLQSIFKYITDRQEFLVEEKKFFNKKWRKEELSILGITQGAENISHSVDNIAQISTQELDWNALDEILTLDSPDNDDYKETDKNTDLDTPEDED